MKTLEPIRFEGFELDPATRSLRRGGQAIPLAPKTFDLLLYLAEHPQQVIGKDQLLSAIWPDAFVEESNLTQHVFLLRKALTAAGYGSRAVVTVPGRGYQFTPAVDPHSLEPSPATLPPQSILLHSVRSVSSVVVEEETGEEAAEPEPLTLPPPPRRRWLWAPAIAALAAIAAGSFLLWRWTRPAPAGHIELVLAEVENLTGDAEFDPVLREALQIDLEQSPYLDLLSHWRIQETLAGMQQPGNARLTLPVAREICERNNGQAVLRGSISRLGSKYIFLLEADSCVTGQLIAGYKTEAGSKEEVLGALDRAAGRLRRRLGESGASLERFQVPIAMVTTPSLEALRSYSLATDSFNRGDMKTAAALYQQAIQLDPNFASAYKSLSWAYYDVDDRARAAEFSKKAFGLRARTSERERLNIEITYHYLASGDLEATARSLKLYLDLYPNSAGNWGNLCDLYTQLGQYRQAIEAGERAWRIDPHSGFVAENLSRAYLRAGRFADARTIAGQSAAAGSERWGTHSVLFEIAFADHAPEAMKAEADWGLTHAQKQMTLDELALAAAASGRLRDAERYFTESRAEAEREGDAEYADASLLDEAYVYLDLEEPQKAAALLRQIHNGGQEQDRVAFVQAESGDLAAAQHALAADAPEQDKNTLHLFYREPMLAAAIALKSGKPADAMRELEPARPYQLRSFAVPYLRAQAETEAGMPEAAEAGYRLILAQPGIDPVSPLYPLAHLRLARLLASEHKTDAAHAEYRAFLAAWKDADGDLPLLLAARREAARLDSAGVEPSQPGHR